MIYLDYNATTPLDKEVKLEIIKALDEFGNPSSSHKLGQRAREIVESSRLKVADLINAEPDEIIFTSGGTESNNLAIYGMVLRYSKGHIITSAIEHPSVLIPCTELRLLGYDLTVLKVSSDGMVDPDDLLKALRKDTVLVTIMHSNNETGVLQPVEEIGKILLEREIAFHTDCAQSIGKVDVNVNSIGATMLTLVGHKFYGPKGVGALFVRKGTKLRSILQGGPQERGLRPGTENTPYIAGFAKASEIVKRDLRKISMHLKNITDRLAKGLLEIPGMRINCYNSPRLPNTLNLTIEGVYSTRLLERIGDRIALSTGSACHSGTAKASTVLREIGLSEEEALCSIRVSTGKFTTIEEIDEAMFILKEEINSLRRLGHD